MDRRTDIWTDISISISSFSTENIKTAVVAKGIYNNNIYRDMTQLFFCRRRFRPSVDYYDGADAWSTVNIKRDIFFEELV